MQNWQSPLSALLFSALPTPTLFYFLQAIDREREFQNQLALEEEEEEEEEAAAIYNKNSTK